MSNTTEVKTVEQTPEQTTVFTQQETQTSQTQQGEVGLGQGVGETPPALLSNS